ncbi:hypothetical protein BDN70DRAFT_675282 [Pholiota conissans]|uniref:Uncharacterized protein n=1 Tax=Pholiota conissans TaxID=109636 RepID=A0A9P5ZEC8_9AGAR|nr:hypothetical protein BDN70DRAFT_675282 [Pholiota conissans]
MFISVRPIHDIDECCLSYYISPTCILMGVVLDIGFLYYFELWTFDVPFLRTLVAVCKDFVVLQYICLNISLH